MQEIVASFKLYYEIYTFLKRNGVRIYMKWVVLLSVKIVLCCKNVTK